jgi:hypothetical protein
MDHPVIKSQGIWLSTETRLRAGRLGFDSRHRRGILFPTASRPTLEPTQLPIQRESGAPNPEIKRPGREADHSPPSSAEVKNAWSYTSTPQHVFIVWCLIKQNVRLHGMVFKHRDNFTFTFTCSMNGRDRKCIKHFAWKTWTEEITRKTWA